MKYVLIYATAKDEEEAKRIGRKLVEEKLAACANIYPVESVYTWEGKICEEKEAAMFIKTRADLAEEIFRRVKELHSYDVPCIISLPVEEGHSDFLKWIKKATNR